MHKIIKNYCDNCGEPLKDKYMVVYDKLPFNVASAYKGESGVLCKKCNEFLVSKNGGE